jgi:hypothetical protein
MIDTAGGGVDEPARKRYKWVEWSMYRLQNALLVIGGILLVVALIGAGFAWYTYNQQQNMSGAMRQIFQFGDGHGGFELIKGRASIQSPLLVKLNASFLQDINMENGGGIQFYPVAPPLHLKRSADVVLPSAGQYGIHFHNGAAGIIDMDGGDIVNVNELQADTIIGTVSSRYNASTSDNIAPGLAVGLLLNGSLGVGFSTNPNGGEPIYSQSQTLLLLPQNSKLISQARLSLTQAVQAWMDDDDGGIQAVVTTVDLATNVSTNSDPVTILPAGQFLLRAFFIVALGNTAGDSLTSALLVWVHNAASANIYARVIDFANPAAPVFQDPFAPTSLGFAALKNIDAFLQSATVVDHTHAVGEAASSRWVVIAFSDFAGNNSAVPLTPNETTTGTPVYANVNGGWVYGFNVIANASATPTWPLNHTTLHQIGQVYGATDVSTSADLAGNCEQCIKLAHSTGSQYTVSWRTNSSLQTIQVEVEQLFLPERVLNLTTGGRFAGYVLPNEQNPSGEDYLWDTSVGQPDSNGVQYYHAGYTIAADQTGHLFTLRIVNGAATSDWARTAIGNDVQYPYSFFGGVLISLSATCGDRVIVTYTTSLYGQQSTVSVLMSGMTPSECGVTGGCMLETPAASLAGIEAYVALTTWQTLGDGNFPCTGLSPFFSAFGEEDQYVEDNTTIYATAGTVGSYTITYASSVASKYVIGVSTGYTNLTTGLVEVQTSGSLNLCQLPFGVLGRVCPYESPFYVYACPNGSLTWSKFCNDPTAMSPGPLLGLANVDGTLDISVAPQAA